MGILYDTNRGVVSGRDVRPRQSAHSAPRGAGPPAPPPPDRTWGTMQAPHSHAFTPLPCMLRHTYTYSFRQHTLTRPHTQPLTLGCAMPRLSNSSGCFRGSSITCIRQVRVCQVRVRVCKGIAGRTGEAIAVMKGTREVEAALSTSPYTSPQTPALHFVMEWCPPLPRPGHPNAYPLSPRPPPPSLAPP